MKAAPSTLVEEGIAALEVETVPLATLLLADEVITELLEEEMTDADLLTVEDDAEEVMLALLELAGAA